MTCQHGIVLPIRLGKIRFRNSARPINCPHHKTKVQADHGLENGCYNFKDTYFSEAYCNFKKSSFGLNALLLNESQLNFEISLTPNRTHVLSIFRYFWKTLSQMSWHIIKLSLEVYYCFTI